MALRLHMLFFTICILLLSNTFSLQENKDKVLLVSFDGFRWDYIFRVPTPNFHYVIENGVYVKQLTNIFLSKTYPNHYTLVTGLFSESHGVVANEMYDPVLDKTFSMTNLDIYQPEFWEEATPIWLTNQDKGHKSGAAMWPGTDVEIHGARPFFHMPYNESIPFEYRVEKLIEWFTSEEPINLGLLYWEEPDETGHVLGPSNPLMNEIIADIDRKVGYLVTALKKAKLWDVLNVIITSDHGMTECSLDRTIELDKYVDRNLYTMVDHSPVIAINPKQGKLEEVYRSLANVHPHMTVYRKNDIPERFHYKNNNRIQPIIAVADLGWTILQNYSDKFTAGNHGYDNTDPDMLSIFLAHGPAFRTDFHKDSMNSIDIYPLLCHLLDIEALPNNGSLRNVKDMLASADPIQLADYEKQESYAYFIGVFLGSVIVVVFLVILFTHLMRSQMPTVQRHHIEIAQPLLQS
ncbi:ectonucleotide pyrophosphatase/phosphodiesterase family member 5 [Ambystoma mexicanum]|uniref:ectonucleotide pyrophosphatase/phosphodiesterase family member 5 n=1 Tax=Ambystoma mexicanum TaxID=8296 RepID=UPI0037E765F7